MKKLSTFLLLATLSFAHNGKAQGFATSPTVWQVPTGGHISSTHSYGFDAMAYAGTSILNNVAWSTFDINGDGKMDIVSTSIGDGTYEDVHGGASAPHWKVYFNTGNGFSTSPTVWQVPTGGHVSSTHSYGFDAISYSGSSTLNNVAWTLMDMNGDYKPDLVVTATGDGTYLDVFGVSSSPYWKVYFNTGTGFSTTHTVWQVPSGGHINSAPHAFGFDSPFYSGSSVANNVAWSTTDINGDGKPDIVVTAQGDGTYLDVPGVSSAPYWKVYFNNGTGFNTTHTVWQVPSGGHISSAPHTYGFETMFYGGSSVANNVSWSTTDINGDKKPDIVVTAQGDGTYLDVPGVSSAPYWKVYFNNGTGFNTTHTVWQVPSGGHISSAPHTYGFESMFYGGSSVLNNVAWSTTDINGDSRPDIICTAVGDGSYLDVFGVSSAPYWKVYYNNGTGFNTTHSVWQVPNGGHVSSIPHTYGFDALFYAGGGASNNTAWSTTDINGNGIPDLVATAIGDGSFLDVFGISSSPYWRVYLNTANITDISEADKDENNFSVFPNPSNGKFYVNTKKLNGNISVFNMLGQTILSVPVNKQNDTELDLGSVPAGVYQIKIGSTSKKVIKE